MIESLTDISPTVLLAVMGIVFVAGFGPRQRAWRAQLRENARAPMATVGAIAEL